MPPDDLSQLIGDVRAAMVQNPLARFAIIGHTELAYDIVAFLRTVSAENRLLGVYGEEFQAPPEAMYKSIDQLRSDAPDVVVIASDTDKERLLEMAAPYLSPEVRVILAGYGHFKYRHPIFEEVVQTALVPSLANGYPNTLPHLFQCLQNASRLELKGVVAEFGMFKGGTTVMLSRFIERLGESWPVIGFDTFEGFPPKRSVLDMYDHPDCFFYDVETVRRYISGWNIEIVVGDIVSTAKRLAGEDVILAFMDTDNFTSASAALDVIQDRIVVGGAIVFDHFAGRNRFRYTLGERLAAKRLLTDNRFFNLHDTGVFLRQR